MFCQHCGSELAPGAKFCAACGAPVNPGDDPAFQDPVKLSIQDGRLVPEPSQQETGQAQQGSVTSQEDSGQTQWESDSAYGDQSDVLTHQASEQQPSAPDKAPDDKKGPRAAVIAAGCAAVLVVVAAAMFILTGRFGTGDAVSFGQKDDVPAKLVTRFNPQDKGGKPFADYSVLLVRQGEQEDGVDEVLYRASTTPYRLEVADDQGFAMSDFGDDVPSGRYACYVVDAGESGRDGSSGAAGKAASSSDDAKASEKGQAENADDAANGFDDDDTDAPTVEVGDDTPCFIIGYDPENGDAQDEVTIREPESGPAGGVAQEEPEKDSQQVAYELYNGKVKEYLAKYGEPGSTTDEFATRLNGLYFARLMDLDGDGLEELVLGYGDPSGAAGDGTTDCTLDVWALKDDALVQVGSVKSASDHGQDAAGWIPIATLDGAPVLFGGKPNVDIEGDVAWYGMVDGKLQAQLRLVVEPLPVGEGQSTLYPPEVRYLVDGKEVDAAAYIEAGKRVQVTENYAVVDHSGSIQTGNGAPLHITQETLQMTKDTIAKLDEAAQQTGATEKDEDAGGKDSEEPASAGFVAKDVKREVEVRIGSDPVQPVEKMTTQWAYPQFFPNEGDPSKELTSLNTSIKEDFEERLQSSQGNERSDLYRYCSDLTMSIQGDIACVRQDRMDAGSHPVREVTPVYYDLKTGKTVSMFDALGIGSDELVQMTVTALNSFLASSKPAGTSPDLDVAALASDSVNKGLVYRTDDALVAVFPNYSFGSYGAGSHELVIKALTDKVQIGDDLVGNYRQP